MSQHLPISLYTAQKVRELDRIAIEDFGIDGFELMRRAGAEAFNALCEKWPEILKKKQRLQVFCGAGNNGGDGYIIAGLAKQKGLSVSVVTLKNADQLTGDARKAFSFCDKLGVEILPFDDNTAVNSDLIVDAMLGTGLQGDVRGDYRKAIDLINVSEVPVLAVDIPSGLCVDTGAVLGTAVRASLTITFIGLKQGLLTAMGPDSCGDLIFAGLDVPDGVYKKQTPSCWRLCQNELTGFVQKRPRHAHKGLYGNILLVGGNHGMPGAIIMAAEAAMACGAGKVTVATRAEHLSALAIRRPEVMASAITCADDFKKLAQNKSAIVVGPGLGQDEWAHMLLKEALASKCPVVMDADALNLVVGDSELLCERKLPIILTPHPGEAARMLSTSTASVQKNRFNAVISIHKQFGAVVVLKGAGTLICSEQSVKLCSAGNPGMAVAGMGDVLSGVIGALLGQGLSAETSASLGVWLHSTAADELVVAQGEVGVLATALIPYIRNRLNRLIARE